MYKRSNLFVLLALALMSWACILKYAPYLQWQNTTAQEVVSKAQVEIDNSLNDEAFTTQFINWDTNKKVFSSREFKVFEEYEKRSLNFFLIQNGVLVHWAKEGLIPSNIDLVSSLQEGFYKKNNQIILFGSRKIDADNLLVATKNMTEKPSILMASDQSSYQVPLLNGGQKGLAIVAQSNSGSSMIHFIFFVGFFILWIITIKSLPLKSTEKGVFNIHALLKYALILLGVFFFTVPTFSPLWMSIVIALPLLEIISSKINLSKKYSTGFFSTLLIGLCFGFLLIILAFFSGQSALISHYYNSIITDILVHPQLIPYFCALLIFSFIGTFVLHKISLNLKHVHRTNLIAPFALSILSSSLIYYLCLSKTLTPFYFLFSVLSFFAFILFIRRSKINYSWLLTWIILLCGYLSVHINFAWHKNNETNIVKLIQAELKDPSHITSIESIKRFVSREEDVTNLLTPAFPAPRIKDAILPTINKIAQEKGYSNLPNITSIYTFDNRGLNVSGSPDPYASEFIKTFIAEKESAIHFLTDKGQKQGIVKIQTESKDHPYSPLTSFISFERQENEALLSTAIWNVAYKGENIFNETSSLFNKNKSANSHQKLVHISHLGIDQSIYFPTVTLSSLVTIFSILMSMSLVLLLVIAVVNSYIHFLPEKIELFISGRQSLRYKIQFTLLSSIIGSFILIAIVTLYNVGTTYQKSHENEINKIVESFNSQFNSHPFLSELHNGNKQMITTLNNFENIHECDLGIYDYHGNKVAINFGSEILEKINPKAYWEFKNDNRNVLFISNNILSRLFYQRTGYIKINGLTKEDSGYVSVSSAHNSSLLSAKLSTFASSLLNIYILLFLIAGAVAIALSNSITRPLAVIGENLKNLKLGKKQAPLKWGNNDELGTLINDYNLTVNKLEESAKLLAITERESAWREMAKQIAHEIKNPLTPMKLSIQHLKLAASRSSNLDIKNMIDRVSSTLLQQIESLSEIATEFSSFAHFPKPENQTVILNEVIATTHDLFRKRDDIDINLYVPIDEIYVFADKNFLLRVFNNLLKNAIQSIPIERRGNVDIRLKKSKNQAIVEIEDNGMGIPPDMYEKIFTPNFTTKSSGTGLGLAISSNIIESFNGRIYFDTTEGHGTTFYVELPLMLKEDNYKFTERVALG